MLQFLDIGSSPLPTLYRVYTKAPGRPEIIPLRYECRNGYYLAATAPEGVTAEISVDGETWHDLIDAPFDLSPFAPGEQDFELRTSSPAGTNDLQLELTETP